MLPFGARFFEDGSSVSGKASPPAGPIPVFPGLEDSHATNPHVTVKHAKQTLQTIDCIRRVSRGSITTGYDTSASRDPMFETE
jgi:hypothetical protein